MGLRAALSVLATLFLLLFFVLPPRTRLVNLILDLVRRFSAASTVSWAIFAPILNILLVALNFNALGMVRRVEVSRVAEEDAPVARVVEQDQHEMGCVNDPINKSVHIWRLCPLCPRQHEEAEREGHIVGYKL